MIMILNNLFYTFSDESLLKFYFCFPYFFDNFYVLHLIFILLIMVLLIGIFYRQQKEINFNKMKS